jgi:hypothetical protein
MPTKQDFLPQGGGPENVSAKGVFSYVSRHFQTSKDMFRKPFEPGFGIAGKF